MKVRMISSDSMHELDAEWLGVTTLEGQQTIGNGHAPYIAQLRANSSLQLHLLGGAITSVPVSGGIVYSDRHLITVILTDDA